MNYGDPTYGKRLILFLGIMTLFLFGREENGATEKKTYKVETVKWGAPQQQNMNTLPYEMGFKNGIYQKEGIDLEFLLIRGLALMAALKNGDLDYVMLGGTTIRSIAAGMPVKVVMTNRVQSGLVLIARPGINSVKQLKEKVVGGGSNIGAATDYAVRAILRYHGLDPNKDVIIRDVPGDMKMAALLSGAVDAGIMSVMEGILLEKKGFKELMSADEVMKGVSQNIVVSLKKLKEEPSQIKKVIRGTLKSIAYAKENRKEAIDFMVKEWGVDRNLTALSYDREIEGFSSDGRVPDEAFQAEVKVGQERGLLPPNLKVPTSQLRDYSLLEEVLKELGIR